MQLEMRWIHVVLTQIERKHFDWIMLLKVRFSCNFKLNEMHDCDTFSYEGSEGKVLQEIKPWSIKFIVLSSKTAFEKCGFCKGAFSFNSPPSIVASNRIKTFKLKALCWTLQTWTIFHDIFDIFTFYCSTTKSLSYNFNSSKRKSILPNRKKSF